MSEEEEGTYRHFITDETLMMPLSYLLAGLHQIGNQHLFGIWNTKMDDRGTQLKATYCRKAKRLYPACMIPRRS